MPAHLNIPISVTLCNYLIRAVAWAVPAGIREDWKREWLAEIWHRWQFLLHAGAWSRREAFRLIGNCFGAFVDAGWQFATQEGVQTRLRDWPRSPWMCVGMLCALLLIVGLVSSGFPATRQLLGIFSGHDTSQLLFIWLHPIVGGGDKGLPSDVAPAWATHSRLLESAASFSIRHEQVSVPGRAATRETVIGTDPALFHVLGVGPALGSFPASARSADVVVLDHATWVSLFHSDPRVIGSSVQIGHHAYRIAAILPADFQFLTRQPSLYVMPRYEAQMMVVVRVRPGAKLNQIDRELTRIAEDACYYFFSSQLRFKFLHSAMLTPLQSFGVAVFVSALISMMVWRVRIRHLQAAFGAARRAATAKRASFFVTKTALALILVFTAGLEWSRSESSVLFASWDPGSGPFLLWLYILGAMGVFSWSLADQRSRCRVCLRLLCFPVRIGCPGCLLLDWSGTELLCTEGHGVLHVPHLAPSWEEESEHWISLDESWSGLFAHTK